MNLEERYKASKASVKPTRYDLVSNIADNVNSSKYNIDSIPSKYNLTSKLDQSVNSSKYNIDSNPKKYHG